MSFLPYGRQSISEEDIAAVVEVLQSDWLTAGPTVDRFEQAVSEFTGAAHAVAVSSGTAALHAAMHALGIANGDEVIVPTVTFAATANAVLYVGGIPVFADVKAGSLLIDPESVQQRITPRTRAIVAVDYAGQPCDYDELRSLARKYNLALVADGCHALGASYRNSPVGLIADLTTFSFHPVKHITTGEGGMVTTGNSEHAERMRAFRNHGITTDHRQRAQRGSYFYEMVDLGFNYRISDLQCALGCSQLRQLPGWLDRRNAIASRYDERLSDLPGIEPLERLGDRTHAYHLYVVRVAKETAGRSRDQIFAAMRDQNIGCNVHYIPVHLHPYYQRNLRTSSGLCPVAEAAYNEILSLPLFPGMSDADVDRVVVSLERAVND